MKPLTCVYKLLHSNVIKLFAKVLVKLKEDLPELGDHDWEEAVDSILLTVVNARYILI